MPSAPRLSLGVVCGLGVPRGAASPGRKQARSGLWAPGCVCVRPASEGTVCEGGGGGPLGTAHSSRGAICPSSLLGSPWRGDSLPCTGQEAAGPLCARMPSGPIGHAVTACPLPTVPITGGTPAAGGRVPNCVLPPALTLAAAVVPRPCSLRVCNPPRTAVLGLVTPRGFNTWRRGCESRARARPCSLLCTRSKQAPPLAPRLGVPTRSALHVCT